jgi:hypothetical protein
VQQQIELTHQAFGELNAQMQGQKIPLPDQGPREQ